MIEPASPEMRRKYAARWKIVGLALLLVGVVGAPAQYVNKSRHMDDDLGAILPGYDKAMHHEMAVEMGPMGLVFMEWSDWLEKPSSQAFLILVGAALGSRACYYIAARLQEDP